MASGAKPSANPTALDAYIARFVKVLQSTAGVDSTLLLTGYSANAIAALLEKAVDANLSSLAESLATTAAKQLRPGETLIATQQIPAGSATARLADTASSLKIFASTASEVRCFMRMWGILKLYVAFRATLRNPPTDPLLRVTTWGKLGSILGYYILEPYWYLSSKNIIKNQPKERTAKAFRVACWAYIVYMLIDYVHLWKVRELREQRRRGEEKVDAAAVKKEEEAWWASVVTNSIYTPLTVHWAHPEGFIHYGVVGATGAIVGLVGFQQAWRAAGP